MGNVFVETVWKTPVRAFCIRLSNHLYTNRKYAGYAIECFGGIVRRTVHVQLHHISKSRNQANESNSLLYDTLNFEILVGLLQIGFGE